MTFRAPNLMSFSLSETILPRFLMTTDWKLDCCSEPRGDCCMQVVFISFLESFNTLIVANELRVVTKYKNKFTHLREILI